MQFNLFINRINNNNENKIKKIVIINNNNCIPLFLECTYLKLLITKKNIIYCLFYSVFFSTTAILLPFSRVDCNKINFQNV